MSQDFKCHHCLNYIHPVVDTTRLSLPIPWEQPYKWFCSVAKCPKCKKEIISLSQRFSVEGKPPTFFRIFPDSSSRNPCPTEVPIEINVDYMEACKCLSISPKASAALSRRCLQHILRKQGYNQKDLAKQIDAVLAETNTKKALPSSLHVQVDAIRNFGNFSAHPINDKTTLQIVDVEEGEAEWCLEIIEALFDHYYVKPSKAQAKIDSLNAKLQKAGKPPKK